MAERQRERQRRQERDEVAGDDGDGRGVATPIPTCSSTGARRPSAPRTPRCRGRAGCRGADRARSRSAHRIPRTPGPAPPHRDHEREVLPPGRLVQQPRRQQREIERRRGLEIDGVGGGGEPVGEDEQGERGGIGAPTSSVREVQARRASRVISQMATAAMPERRQVICQAVKSAALIAAPPVEKSTAAAASWRTAGENLGMGGEDRAGRRAAAERAAGGAAAAERNATYFIPSGARDLAGRVGSSASKVPRCARDEVWWGYSFFNSDAGNRCRGPSPPLAVSRYRYAAMFRASCSLTPSVGIAVPGSTESGRRIHAARFAGVLIRRPAM